MISSVHQVSQEILSLNSNGYYGVLSSSFAKIRDYYDNNISLSMSLSLPINQTECVLFAQLISDKILNSVSNSPTSYLSSSTLSPARDKVQAFEFLFKAFKFNPPENYTSSPEHIKFGHIKKLIASILIDNLQPVWESITVSDYIEHGSAKSITNMWSERIETKYVKEKKLANTVLFCFFPSSTLSTFSAPGVDMGKEYQIQIGEGEHNSVLSNWVVKNHKSLGLINYLMQKNSAFMSGLNKKFKVAKEKLGSVNVYNGKHPLFLSLPLLLAHSAMNYPLHQYEAKICKSVLVDFNLTPPDSIAPFFDMVMHFSLSSCTPSHQKRIVEQMKKGMSLPLIEFLIKNNYSLSPDLEILKEKLKLESSIPLASTIQLCSVSSKQTSKI